MNNVFCERFPEYEVTRKQLFCRLADPCRQEDGCRGVLSRPWLDLRICCYYDMKEEGVPGAALTIYENCLSLWHVTAERVLEDAWRNTTERKTVFRPLDKVLYELHETMEWMDLTEIRNEASLYVLTNSDRMNGAVYMAVPGVMNRIAKELDADFYILPSSIHECLILPDTGLQDDDWLNHLVSFVNRECVPEEEILTDHVYFYDRMLQHVRPC